MMYATEVFPGSVRVVAQIHEPDFLVIDMKHKERMFRWERDDIANG
jgi:hypothetical protein